MKLTILFFSFLFVGVCTSRADYDVTVTGSTSGAVWGSGPYTDDSNVAVAAVHAGLIAAGQTGTIHVRLVGGQSSYPASTRNGVTTYSYGAWGGSYTLSLVSGGGNVAPTVSLSLPTSVYVNQSFDVTVNAGDANEDLNSVGLRYQGVGQIGWWALSGGSASRSMGVTAPSSSGTIYLRGEVFDNAGNGTTGAWYAVQVSAPPSNQPPVGSMSGSTSLVAGQTGSWTYTATDANANLARWRVSLLPNTAAWVNISGGSQSSGFNYPFMTAGTYTWNLVVEDSNGASHSSTCSVTVTAAPAGALAYDVSASTSSFTSYPQGAPNYAYLTDGVHHNGYGYASDTAGYNWLKADLGSPKLIQNVYLGGGDIVGWGPASSYSSGAVLEYSTDNISWTTAYTFTNGFASGGTVASPNQTARYWRIARNSWLATTEFRFAGVAVNAPSISSSLTAGGAVNASFSYQIVASNSPTSYSAVGLPAGLSINASTGLISGAPAGPGTVNVTLGATNAGGAGSATLVLTVSVPSSPPVITTQPSSQTVATGTTATFNVMAAGSPTPTYQWRKDGTPIAGARGSTYTRTNVQSVHAGSYDVVVTNSAGSVISAAATLSVFAVPAAPVAHAPTNITASGLTANWTVVSGAAKYRLDVSTAKNFSTFVPGYQNLDVGNTVTKAVTGLTASSTYYYRVRAESGGFPGASSNVITITAPLSATVSWFDVDGDGLFDEVSPSGSNGYSYQIDNIWLEALEIDQYVINFDAWFDFYSPDGFFLPEFGFTWSMVPSVGSYETRLTHFHGFTAEPGYRYEIWGSRNGGGMWLKEWGPLILSAGDALDVGYYSGWWHPDDFLSSLFYLVRFGKPIGSVNIGALGTASLGTSRGLGGLLNAAIPSGGSIAIGVKDAAERLLRSGPNIIWEVWEGISQIRVGSTTLGGLIDIGINSAGHFQVGLKLDDTSTVWFNLDVAAPPPPKLAVDANRDGTITFDAADGTSVSQPYRFWLNDDDDVSSSLSVAWSDPDPEHYPPRQAGSANQIVDSPRDCEDLTRIWISVPEIIGRLKDPSSDLYLGLKWMNMNGTHPGIRLFRSADSSGGLRHIRETAMGVSQAGGASGSVASMRTCLGDADAQALSAPQIGFPWTGITQVEPIARAADFIFRKDFLPDVFGDRSVGYLLFEGVQEGKGELVVVVVRKKSDGSWERVVEGGGVVLQLDNIRRMYVRAHSLPLAENFPLPWQVNTPPPSPYEEDLVHEKALRIPDVRLWYGAGDSVESSEQFPFVPSPGEQNKCVIFVHGIDMDVPQMHGYTHSFFKRLWWEGYRGRFVSFRWCTPLSSDGLFGWDDTDENTSIFNSGEYRSWKGGSSLKKFVDALRNQASPFYFSSNPTIGLLAHSLGNACAGEALRQGMQVNSYVALKAAVPLSCYFPVGTLAPIDQTLVDADAVHPTPQYAGSSNGYHGYLSSLGSANKVSYYGASDFWLTTGNTSFGLAVDWVTNERKNKPDDPWDHWTNSSPIKYIWDGGQLKAYFRRDVFHRLITDPHESMAFVSRPRTWPLGAHSPPPNFSGLDLDGPTTYAFGQRRSDHSGPFQRDIQLMYGSENGAPWSEPLYVRLMRDLQMNP